MSPPRSTDTFRAVRKNLWQLTDIMTERRLRLVMQPAREGTDCLPEVSEVLPASPPQKNRRKKKKRKERRPEGESTIFLGSVSIAASSPAEYREDVLSIRHPAVFPLDVATAASRTQVPKARITATELPPLAAYPFREARLDFKRAWSVWDAIPRAPQGFKRATPAAMMQPLGLSLAVPVAAIDVQPPAGPHWPIPDVSDLLIQDVPDLLDVPVPPVPPVLPVPVPPVLPVPDPLVLVAAAPPSEAPPENPAVPPAGPESAVPAASAPSKVSAALPPSEVPAPPAALPEAPPAPGALAPAPPEVSAPPPLMEGEEDLEWDPSGISLMAPRCPSKELTPLPSPRRGQSQPEPHLSVSRKGRGHRRRGRVPPTLPPYSPVVPRAPALLSPASPPASPCRPPAVPPPTPHRPPAGSPALTHLFYFYNFSNPQEFFTVVTNKLLQLTTAHWAMKNAVKQHRPYTQSIIHQTGNYAAKWQMTSSAKCKFLILFLFI
ncbi:uncharacterized protein [Paramormyrops kingsleyae]|uniref:uncharacterized protein isoform X1 n=1 Tax=Paramormyrops kingsleyae TaxID=1676925 RepID=UPI000CD5FF5A|nr:proline-rich protein 36-like [Paramormyrops kingsleyae]